MYVVNKISHLIINKQNFNFLKIKENMFIDLIV
jgi:hypothetical protein